MTAFFVAGTERERAEAAYSELRAHSEVVVGCAARSRRIFKISCRFEGSDCEIEVGGQLSGGGDAVVAAILDHGRDEAYVVHTEGNGDGTGRAAGAVRVGRPVYAVTEFS